LESRKIIKNMKARKIEQTIRLNEERLQSRGKTDKILQMIADAGPEGVRYTDIIRFAYEDTYGKGSYDADTEPTKNHKFNDRRGSYRTGGNPHRGYWSGGFKTPSRDDRGWGHLMKYIQKNDKGRWILRNEKMSPEEEEAGSKFMEWPGKTPYKERNYPSTRGDYDETGKYRPRISKRYADAAKARGEWTKNHDDAYQIVDDEE
jgi:hypothetical protein